jgi:RNA polymerase Rpb2, domain 6/RNA polymerase Rpb1, domain 2
MPADKPLKTVLDQGRLRRVPDDEPHDYEFRSPADMFSHPANLIPGLGGVSGGRVLLGAKAALQALSLTHREAPLVPGRGRAHERDHAEIVGRHFLGVSADVDGTVTEATPDHVAVRHAGGTKVYELHNLSPLGAKTYHHQVAVVKPGDKVKAGDLLASSNYTDAKGNAALGVNLRTAVMPWRSGNFEDALVLTESGARKLEADQLIRERLELRLGVQAGKNRYIGLFPSRFTGAQLAGIGEDGLARKGVVLKFGDPVILALAPRSLQSVDMALGRLSKVLKHAWTDHAVTWDYEAPGEVVESLAADDHATVLVRTRRPMQVGDKLSNPFGAKGVVAAILPDSRAPVDAEGKPVDILLNSMSITSRVAPSLVHAMVAGKVAQKTGKPGAMPHFTSGSRIDSSEALLKEHGLSDTEELTDPSTGKTVKVLTGPLYFTRLVHIAEDKESHRSAGSGYDWNRQPTKSTEESAKRLGNLGTSALLSHGATAVLRDIATVKATKNDEYWRRVKLGHPPPSPTVPFIFTKFLASMQGAGINVRKEGDQLHLLPMTDKDVERLSAGPVKEALTFQVKDEKLVPEKGGLFDPAVTGVQGERYTHVELAQPVPNPVSEDFLRKLLGVTKAEFMELVKSGKLAGKLAAVDLAGELEAQEKILRSGRKTKREDALKLVAFLRALQRNRLHPQDLMLTKIPVIPAMFRPATVQGDFGLSADVNYLYKDLILTANELKQGTEDLPAHVADQLRQRQYDAVKAVYGLGDPVTVKHQEKGFKGLLATTLGLRGGMAKGAMFQAKVVNKPMDLVGRAVLVPDAGLGLDQASVPANILWKAYQPFIIRRLVQRGVPATRAQEYVEGRHSLAQEALQAELAERPAIVSRDPALHKFNLSGFFLKPNADPKDRTIKLSPLVFKGFNADNDGDQLGINVPAGDDARREVIEKMLPSRTLLSPRHYRPAYMPSNEASLGLFQLSTEKREGKEPKAFASAKEVVQAFHRGELHPGDPVKLAGGH